MAGWPMGSRGSSPSSPEPGRRSGGRVPARWPSGPAAGNTQATQVRELAKINTPVTRTRRHSPAHGGTIARIGDRPNDKRQRG